MPRTNQPPTIRIYGVKPADPEYGAKVYENGVAPFLGGEQMQYVDYEIEDMVTMLRATNSFNDFYNIIRKIYVESN